MAGQWIFVDNVDTEEVDAFAGVDDGTARFYEETSSYAPAVYKVDEDGIKRLTSITDASINGDCNVPVGSHRAYADAHGGGITACLIPNYLHLGAVVPHVHFRAAPGDVGSAYVYDLAQFDDLLGYSYSSAKFDLSLHAKRGRATLSATARRGDGYVSGAWRVNFGTTSQGSTITRLAIPVTLSALPSAPWTIFESHTQDRTAVCVETQIFIFDNGAASPTRTVQSPVGLNGAIGTFDSEGKLHLVHIPGYASKSIRFDIEAGTHEEFTKGFSSTPNGVQPGLDGKLWCPALKSSAYRYAFDGETWSRSAELMHGTSYTTSNGKIAQRGPSDEFYVTVGQQSSGKAAEIWRYRPFDPAPSDFEWKWVADTPSTYSGAPWGMNAQVVYTPGRTRVVSYSETSRAGFSKALRWLDLDELTTALELEVYRREPATHVSYGGPTAMVTADSMLYVGGYKSTNRQASLFRFDGTTLPVEKLDAGPSAYWHQLSGFNANQAVTLSTGEILVFVGLTSDTGTNLHNGRSISRYLPGANVWEPYPVDQPVSSDGAGLAVDNDDNVWVFGGSYASNKDTIYKLDTKTYTWTLSNTRLPAITYGTAAQTMADGRILLVGGSQGQPSNYASNACYIFDPKTELISNGPTFPIVVTSGGLVRDDRDGTMYYVGGGTDTGTPSNATTFQPGYYRLVDKNAPPIVRKGSSHGLIKFVAEGDGKVGEPMAPFEGAGHAVVTFTAPKAEGKITYLGGDATEPGIRITAKGTAPEVHVGLGEATVTLSAGKPWSKVTPVGAADFAITFSAEMGEGAHVLVTGDASESPIVFDTWGEWRPNVASPGHAKITFTAWGTGSKPIIGRGYMQQIRINMLRPRGRLAYLGGAPETTITFRAVGSWIAMADDVDAPIVLDSTRPATKVNITFPATEARIHFRASMYGRVSTEAAADDAVITLDFWADPWIIGSVSAATFVIEAEAEGFPLPPYPREVVLELPSAGERTRLAMTVTTVGESDDAVVEVV